jgi:hypothetical protein
MTSPGHYENVGSHTGSIEFSGFVQQPNRWVELQARTLGDGRWETIGYARSDQTPYQYSGNNWYSWSTWRRVPSQYWVYLDGAWWAEVRAVDYYTRSSLYTFEGDFYSYFNPSEPLEQLWSDHGHGTSVTISGR